MSMNETEKQQFHLVREMLETPHIIRRFDASAVGRFAELPERAFLTGEGSSRLFPAKHLRYRALRNRYRRSIFTDGAMQTAEYALGGSDALFVASNSGKTSECVRLIRAFGDGATGRGSGETASSAEAGSRTGTGSETGAARPRIVGLTATEGSPLALESDQAFVLGCGSEQAVAATKSVIEQAVFYDVLFRKAEAGGELDLEALADGLEQTLDADLPPSLADRLSRLTAAPTLYFAGRDDGVGEELALKTNEITRKRSGFLEGTYALHGVEEVLTSDEVVVLVEPFEEEEARFEEVLVGEVGMEVVAIASRQTRFPTLVLPDPAGGDTQSPYIPYLQLAAGWNLLVAIGMAAGVNVDEPERARKIGNEYRGG